MDYDDERRAMARCEADYLRTPEHDYDDLRTCLPDDIEQLTPEHVRAEVARIDRLRDDHDDEKRAGNAERLFAFCVLRAIAREGHPLALAAVTDPYGRTT